MSHYTCQFEGCQQETLNKRFQLCPGHRAEYKRCPACEEIKPLGEFGTRTTQGRRYPTSRCKLCLIEASHRPRREAQVVYAGGKKRCPGCATFLPFDKFSTRNDGKPYSRCRACVAEANRLRIASLDETQLVEFKRRKALSTSKYPHSRKARALRFQYKMTLETYETMLAEQGGVCAICRMPEVGRTKGGLVHDLAVDHDHACCPEKGMSCGKCIRGLICGNCNKGLGAFQDNPDFMRAAIAYLAQHTDASRCTTTRMRPGDAGRDA